MTSEEIARMREYGKDYSNLTQAYTKSEMFAALDEIERLRGAALAVLKEPYGCRFCDIGKFAIQTKVTTTIAPTCC